MKENWNSINLIYKNSNPECDYSRIMPFYGQLQNAMNHYIDFLQYTNATAADLAAAFEPYRNIFVKYSPAVLDYILNNDKACYFIPRQVRTFPSSIADFTYAAVMRCIGYKDKDSKVCSMLTTCWISMSNNYQNKTQ